MLKKKNNIFLLIIAMLAFCLAGCDAPTGDPADVLNDYYNDIAEGDYEEAYEYLTYSDTINVKKEEFILWQSLVNERAKLESFKVLQVGNIQKNVTLERRIYSDGSYSKDEIYYPYAANFNVQKTIIDHVDDAREKTFSENAIVVNEPHSWKIYVGNWNIKEQISQVYVDLGLMHTYGNGMDFDRAIESFNSALEYSHGNAGAYYGLANAYLNSKEYDEAIRNVDIYIGMAKEPENISNGWNIKGIIFQEQGDHERAVAAYEKSLEFNSENENSMNNLKHLNGHAHDELYGEDHDEGH